MVGILRKIMQIIKTARGPVLKLLAPLMNSFAPGVGDLVAKGANEVIDRSSNTLDAYEAAQEAGEDFKFHDGVKAFFGDGPPPSKGRDTEFFGAPPGAMKTKTKDYGGLHPRLQLKAEDFEEEEDI
jgi:hypothetical protein